MSTQEEHAVGTFAEEDGLPRVPVPGLADSRDRLLEWCAPLVDAEALAATRAAVDELLAPDGPGPVLQSALESYAASAHTWLDDFWESRYLGRRDRIALNANFCFLFAPSDAAGGTAGEAPAADRAERAARLIVAALAYKRAVDTETLPVVRRRDEAMSMEQVRYLFSATRVPGAEQDTARTPYTDEHPGPSDARHVLVFRRGRMFAVDVVGPDGAPHAVEEIAGALRSLDDVEAAAPGTAVGHLTTKARAAWAASRAALLDADPANAAALDAVESALVGVALEDDVPADDSAATTALLGGDSANRWFDKAITFVVFGDGTAGINTEHCRLDGTTVLMLVDAMFAAPTATHAEHAGARPQGTPATSEVAFVLDDARRADVTAAGEDFAAFTASIANELVAFPDVGADVAKGLGVSPDAFCQMSYQLAHARSKGFVGATYESIATRQFHHGRTEAMRVVTPEILAFVAAMDDPSASAQDRRAAFSAAADAHVARAKDAQAGRAPEQHLWELALIAQRRGAELGVAAPLAVVGSPGWRVMRDDYLSTSSAPSENVRAFAFGSTSAHCIGVAYVLLPDRLLVHLSTPASVQEQMRAFARELRRAFDEVVALLREGAPARAGARPS